TLIYNGQGRKFNETATCVGYGWQLDIGSSLKRQVNGMPDDVPYEYSAFHNFKYTRGFLNHNLESSNIIDNGGNDLITNAGKGALDFQPDIFHYTLPGSSSKFSLARGSAPCDGEVIGDAVEYQKTSNNITTNYSLIDNPNNSTDYGCFDFFLDIEGFTIKNENGIEYTFQKGDRILSQAAIDSPCEDDATCKRPIEYFDTWSISQIKNLHDDVLASFQYASNSHPYSQINRAVSISHFPADVSQNSSRTEYDESIDYVKFINRIDFIKGYILFTRSQNSDGYPYLEKIEYFTNSDDLIGKVKFEYDHTIGSEFTLQNIQYLNSDLVVYNKIDFTYRDGVTRQINNNDFDHWGYINGINQNATVPLSFDGPNLGNLNQANRSSNLSTTEHRILKDIQYSNGSKESFEYELNQFGRLAGQTIDLPQPITKTYTAGYNEVSNWIEDVSNPDGGYYTWVSLAGSNFNYLEVETDQYVNFQINHDGYNYTDPYNDCDRRIEVKIVKHYTGNPPTFILSDDDNDIYLEEGTYLIYARQTVNELPTNITTNIYQECPSQYTISFDYPNGLTAGGLRIKAVTKIDGNGSRYLTRYKYDRFDEPGVSSGILLTPYIYHAWIQENLSGSSQGPNPYGIGTASNMINNLLFQSGPVMYLNVETETIGYDINGSTISSSETIGKSRTTFRFADNAYSNRTYPYAPIQIPDNTFGIPQKQEIYNADNKKISEIIYSYDFLRDNSNFYVIFGEIEGTKFALRKLNWSVPQSTLSKYYARQSYTLDSKFFYLKTKIVRNYDEEENLIEEKETAYDYRSDGIHLKPIQITSTLPNGSQSIIRNKFIGDFPFTQSNAPQGAYAGTIQTLWRNKLYSLPIEQAIFIKKSGDVEKLLTSRMILYESTNGVDIPIAKLRKSTKLEEPLANYEMSHKIDMGNEDDELYIPEVLSDDIEFTIVNDNNLVVESRNSDDLYNSLLLNHQADGTVAKIYDGKLANSRYTSFEDDDFFGGWNISEENIVDAPDFSYALTGDKYYNLGTVDGNDGDFDSGNLLPKGKYILSYWSKGNVSTSYGSGSVELENSSFSEGDWNYNEKIIEWTSNDNSISITGDGNIDELRLHELNATMQTQGNFADGKLKYESSITGNVVTYEYDVKGRLEWVLNRKRNVIEHHQYGEKEISDPNSYNKHTLYTAKDAARTKTNIRTAGEQYVAKHIEFTDGLGRFRQAIDFGVYNYGTKRVSFVEYDSFGRSLTKYLPYYYADNESDTDYIPDASSQQLNYYSNQTDPNEESTAPFAITKVETSPLQRPTEIGGVGEELQPENGHGTQIAYGWNTSSDNIRKWQYDASNAAAYGDSHYAPNELRKETITDPDGRIISLFTDARGRKVATTMVAELRLDGARAYTGNVGSGGTLIEKKLTSYTVYDDFGRVVFDIPAKAMEEL
ncbi:hypothetical protein G3O08_20360, partial [Cryomorpha ignava]